jgi:protein translocase SecG subunit
MPEMQSLPSILPYIQIGLSVLLVASILLQRSGAGLGGAFGDSSNFSASFHKRRGPEKFLFNATIVLAILFVASAFVALILV